MKRGTTTERPREDKRETEEPSPEEQELIIGLVLSTLLRVLDGVE